MTSKTISSKASLEAIMFTHHRGHPSLQRFYQWNGNEHDVDAVGVLKSGSTLGHVPRDFFLFLN